MPRSELPGQGTRSGVARRSTLAHPSPGRFQGRKRHPSLPPRPGWRGAGANRAPRGDKRPGERPRSPSPARQAAEPPGGRTPEFSAGFCPLGWEAPRLACKTGVEEDILVNGRLDLEDEEPRYPSPVCSLPTPPPPPSPPATRPPRATPPPSAYFENLTDDEDGGLAFEDAQHAAASDLHERLLVMEHEYHQLGVHLARLRMAAAAWNLDEFCQRTAPPYRSDPNKR